MAVTKEYMMDVAKKAVHYQDIGDAESQMKLYAKDCTFNMPHIPEPLKGFDELHKDVANWPKSTTVIEWFVAEDNRLAMGWNWRGEGFPENIPLNRGISYFVFNDDGLIQDYEDFFDPDWATRHAQAPAEASA